MKQMNNDAKVLIRSYIDNIEEYLKNTCKMHPNEIDALLNEINDFMYIRSNELASERTISHSNALQAMEECGSPSEICEQYLDTETGQSSPILKTQVKSGSRLKSKSTTSSSFRGVHTQREPTVLSPTNYIGHLRAFKVFGFYRLITAPIFILSIITVVMTPYGYTGQAVFSYDNVRFLIQGLLSIGFMWLSVFLILEGWLIPRWKTKIASKGFAQELDNRILVTVSRTGFLALLLKASLLPMPWNAAIFLPFLVISQILVERQLKSNLWTNNLAPFLINIAHSLDNGELISQAKQGLGNVSFSIQTYSKNERTALLFGGAFFLFSLLFSWGYGWNDIVFIRSYYRFETERLLPMLAIHLLIACIILITLIAVSFSPGDQENQSNFQLNTLSFWIGRLLGVRTLMMVTAYYYEYFWSFGALLTLLLLLVYAFYEITIGFQRHQTLKKSIVSGLQYLGQDPVLVSSRNELPPTVNRISESLPTIPIVSRHPQPSTSPQPTSVSNSGSLIPHFTPSEIPAPRKSRSKLNFLASALYTLLIPVFILIKAVVVAVILLLGTVYEVVLFILIILTGRSIDGSYLVPTYSFSFQSNATVEFGGITIWSWYLLGALAVQIFLLVVIALFQFVRKKPDGLIIMFFRNFSRILLFGLLLGSLYQEARGDLYAMPRIIILIVLFIFMELTSLKIRLERRKWKISLVTLPQESEIENRPLIEKAISSNSDKKIG